MKRIKSFDETTIKAIPKKKILALKKVTST